MRRGPGVTVLPSVACVAGTGAGGAVGPGAAGPTDGGPPDLAAAALRQLPLVAGERPVRPAGALVPRRTRLLTHALSGVQGAALGATGRGDAHQVIGRLLWHSSDAVLHIVTYTSGAYMHIDTSFSEVPLRLTICKDLPSRVRNMLSLISADGYGED